MDEKPILRLESRVTGIARKEKQEIWWRKTWDKIKS